MMRVRLIGLMLFVMWMHLSLAVAQDSGAIIEPASDAAVNPAAHISFPPPVYVVRGSDVKIRGTITLPDMESYFIELRQLNLDETAAEDAPWFPVTLAQRNPVEDGVLGIWNTFIGQDGLHELRMTINTGGDAREYVRVSPIRVENDVPPFLQAEMAAMTAADEAEEMTADAEADTEPATITIEVEATSVPAPTPTPEDTSPRVVAVVDSNVRAGDSTQYQRVGFLLTDETARIRGISSRGTGWYYIEMRNGRTGFIHPNIVRTEGDLSNLERVAPPPPPPPTPIPIIPTAAPPPAPATGANLAFVQGSVKIEPHPATCGQAYKITVTVTNNGNGASNSGGLIRVTDTRQEGNVFSGETTIAFGPLNPGQSQEVFGHLTVSIYYDELHNINLTLDADNQVAETNENDNRHATAPYILKRGDC